MINEKTFGPNFRKGGYEMDFYHDFPANVKAIG